MMVVYMHRGARLVLPEAVDAQQSGEETHFVDKAGKLVAMMQAQDVWLYADHDPIDDIDPEMYEDVDPTSSET